MKLIKPTKTISANSKSELIDHKEKPDQQIEGLYSDAGLRVSEEEYWDKYYTDSDFAYEWNNGILEVKPMADYKSSKVYRWFLRLIEEYLNGNPIAKFICLDIGFKMKLKKNKTTIRKPDLAFVLNSNSIALNNDDSTFKGSYDLCVEFLSDSQKSEIERDTVVKKAEYCQAGIKEYFIIDRNARYTAFYRLNQQGFYSNIPQPDNVLSSNVLPGFQFLIDDLYIQPDLHDKIKDPIYNSFVLLEYQQERQRTKQERQRTEQEKQRAEQEKQRAEQEKQRAEQEKQRAEQEKQRADSLEEKLDREKQKAEALAEKLSKLGIDPESL